MLRAPVLNGRPRGTARNVAAYDADGGRGARAPPVP